MKALDICLLVFIRVPNNREGGAAFVVNVKDPALRKKLAIHVY